MPYNGLELENWMIAPLRAVLLYPTFRLPFLMAVFDDNLKDVTGTQSGKTCHSLNINHKLLIMNRVSLDNTTHKLRRVDGQQNTQKIFLQLLDKIC